MHSSASRLQTVVISRKGIWYQRDEGGGGKVIGVFSSDVVVTRKGHISILYVTRIP